ncbi:hypothetical protein [Enterovibrio norvegicus]|uniref:hypothetical protein n=1 Tax=Enterovibrio norvegicus TaxID=188144 RepID=UPI00352FB914
MITTEYDHYSSYFASVETGSTNNKAIDNTELKLRLVHHVTQSKLSKNQANDIYNLYIQGLETKRICPYSIILLGLSELAKLIP